MPTRRQVLKGGVASAGALLFPRGAWLGAPGAMAAARRQIARYTVPLPIPVTATPIAANTYRIALRQTRQILHPSLGPTAVWGYDDGSHGPLYPGPTIEARRGTPITVSYVNQLPASHLFSVDTNLTEGDSAVRMLTHLHGGFVSGTDDGNPYATPDEFTPGETQTVHYPNEQQATALWYHDHAVGITRLNVYAGLAGYYLIRDDHDTGAEPNPIGIPGGRYEVPLVIQDRTFDAAGQLSYPGSWLPEFFGDTILVNGAPWPFFDVEPRKYRFRILNGSNSRFYNLEFADGPSFHHIGAEGGMFDAPVRRRQLLVLPAERADVIVDFSRNAGDVVVLRNMALPAGIVSPGDRIPAVMQFRVGTTVTDPGPATIPSSLPGAVPTLPSPVRSRVVTLEELLDAAGRPLRSLLDGKRFEDPADIAVPAGSIEDWLLVNLTADTHPIHVHLTQFQVLDRRPFDVAGYQAALDAARRPGGTGTNPDPTAHLTGEALPSQSDDHGFKDTVASNPGVVTRIRARFDLPSGVFPPQKYVFHCHILEHEDNDMMRPYRVI